MRSPAAYAGVTAYARAHTGEAPRRPTSPWDTAYLSDHRYPDAAASFQKANALGKTMDDYADSLAAQASMEAGSLVRRGEESAHRFCRKIS